MRTRSSRGRSRGANRTNDTNQSKMLPSAGGSVFRRPASARRRATLSAVSGWTGGGWRTARFPGRDSDRMISMLRTWCLAVLVCLSIWTIGGDVAVRPDEPRPGAEAVACDLNAPFSDEGSNRQWEAQRTVACPAASVWTSQLHHAVLATSRGLQTFHASNAPDEPASEAPRAHRSQVNSPLLI